jgi:hypothetical protein
MRNELEVKLESMIETLKEMQNVLSKSKSNVESISNTILYKNIEDGILNNIHNANNYQLNMIMNNYKFNYYTEFNYNRDLLKNEINNRLRDYKLNRIL